MYMLLWMCVLILFLTGADLAGRAASPAPPRGARLRRVRRRG